MRKFLKNNKLKYILLTIIMLNILVITVFYKEITNFSAPKIFNNLIGVLSNDNADIRLEVLVDGKKQDEFPDKNNYKYDGYSCTNDATITWYDDMWRAEMNLSKPAVCVLKFISNNNNTIENKNQNVNNSCKVIDGKYYDNNGYIVSESEFNKRCITNPKTGRFVSYIFICFAIILAIIIFKIVRKNNKIYKI